jgi:hypothetical protein
MDNTGNLLGSSIPLDTNQNWQVIEAGLDNTDDYYSFQLSNRSSFNLVLNSLSDNADLRLLNHNGSEISSSSREGTSDENINQILDAGTYFIEVHQVDDAEISYGLEYRSNYIPEKFQFNTEAIDGGIRLTDAKIFDPDGVNDLQKVDFWLRKKGERWEKLNDSVSEFSSNTDSSIGFNYEISNLGEGEYELWARATDNFGARSNGWKESFTVKNIVDSEVVNLAPSNLDFGIKQISGGIELTNTQVFDPDGIDDLEKIDFQLKQEDGEWIDIQDAVDFIQNQDDSIGFEYSIGSLQQGNYQLRAIAYDKSGTSSDGLITSFQVKNVAPSILEFDIETIVGGVRLTNTRIFDANGIDDFDEVKFWLQKDNGNWNPIEKDAVTFGNNEDGSISFDYSIDSLTEGNYNLLAKSSDKALEYINLQKSFTITNSAPILLDFSPTEVNGEIQIVDAKVIEPNGINDLEKVDFELKKEGGEWVDIEDALNFSENEDASIGFEYSISGLEQGNYQLKATVYDKAGASDVLERQFQVQDWFDRNIQDVSIRTLSRSLFSDNSLSRNDMISILGDAKDNSIVDATEINDLDTIIENASYLGIADYVRVLSNKVVNGDVANKSGNLQAGSTDVELDKLINKWFLGSDRPETYRTSDTYQYAQGSLFQNGISHDDIRQGYINNCFFLAALGATVVQSPDIIQNMFIDNGDGTFTVRFYNQGDTDYVTVDRYLPTNNIGNFVYANAGDYHGNDNNELWVALAEKAYAQLYKHGWINQENSNSYKGIGNAGYLSHAFAHITGKKSVLGRQLNFNRIVETFNSGEVVGFGSKSSGTQSNIVASHAYALINYNEQTQKFTLLNPWSTDNNALKSRTLELSWNEITNNFSYWDSTISNVIST